jgi:phage I-like protein
MDRNAHLTASCSAALSVGADGAASKWVQLFPGGTEIKALDGRVWSNPDPAAVIAASKVPVPIDYDHGSERPTAETQNTRAAGWIEQYSAHGPSGESGIWARVEWTPEGGKAVAAKEYRFISPTFTHTKDGNVIVKILRAALINVPALEMKALASAQQETPLDVKKIAAALGLPDTATIEDCVNAIASLRTGNTAMTGQLKTVATAAGLTADKIGDNEVAAVCAKLKTPAKDGEKISAAAQTQIDELNKTVATLTARLDGKDARAEVDIAIAAGKITPAQKDWAIGYCSRDPEGFKTFIGASPTILASGRVAPAGGVAAKGELDDDQKAICVQLGVAPDKFKASLAAMTKEAA